MTSLWGSKNLPSPKGAPGPPVFTHETICALIMRIYILVPFIIIGSMQACQLYTITIVYIVSPEASLTEGSLNNTYNRGDTAILLCTSRGGPNNTYQWLANGTEWDGQSSQNLSLANVTAIDGGMYTCVVSNLAGSDNASTFVFIEPYIVSDPVGDKISIGSTVVLTCGAEAFPNPEYLWVRPDGRNISGTNHGRNLTIASIEYGDEGEYYCNASARGMTAMSEIAVVVGELFPRESIPWAIRPSLIQHLHYPALGVPGCELIRYHVEIVSSAIENVLIQLSGLFTYLDT